MRKRSQSATRASVGAPGQRTGDFDSTRYGAQKDARVRGFGRAERRGAGLLGALARGGVLDLRVDPRGAGAQQVGLGALAARTGRVQVGSRESDERRERRKPSVRSIRSSQVIRPPSPS